MTKAIAGPDPSPVKPKYVPPPGACDAHCHIFGPAAKFPYALERRYTPPDSPKEKLRALHEHLGFSRAVLVQASCHGADNRAMLDAIDWSRKFEPGAAWRGVAMVGNDVSVRELERTLAMIEPLGWHVVLHLDAEDIESHAELFRRIRVPFVIDHMGRIQAAHGLDQRPFRMLLDLMMKNELAWVKVSGPERVSAAGKPFHDAMPFAEALVESAPERVLWGTDFPHPNVKTMPNDGELVDFFAKVVPDEKIRKRILVDNPARLYWAGARN